MTWADAGAWAPIISAKCAVLLAISPMLADLPSIACALSTCLQPNRRSRRAGVPENPEGSQGPPRSITCAWPSALTTCDPSRRSPTFTEGAPTLAVDSGAQEGAVFGNVVGSAWTASIGTISALQNKHRIALNRSFINEVHGARGSLL
jgi:hypothetical protein